MKDINLDIILKNMYNSHVSFLRRKNIELERKYFTKNSNRIPLSELLQGESYEDIFASFKEVVKKNKKNDISHIFMLLQDYLLFSNGRDKIYKYKLEADIFEAVPMEDFIYPKLSKAVKEKYNDFSIIKKNPNSDKNIEDINRIIFTYIELQSLLNLLYCNEFQFPNGWEELYPDTHEELLNILNNSEIKIGDYLHALIDFKCNIMSEIFSEIENPQLRKQYLEKVKSLKEMKHEETNNFVHINLPITYFLNHTFSDFMNLEYKSSILDDRTSNGTKKILIPKPKKND